MFSSHAPSSSPYAFDHRQPRSPPSPASPLPTGECRFILLHPSIQNQRCSCQGFRLNRTIPGSSCECGHLACYHVPSTPSHDNINLVSFTQHIALMEMVRRLEEDLVDSQRALEDTQKALEDVQKARADDSVNMRDTMRRMWRAMDGKLVGLEDKVEAAMDMACEAKDDVKQARAKLESVEDSAMALESKMDNLNSDDDEQGGKRRRMRRSSATPCSKKSSPVQMASLPSPAIKPNDSNTAPTSPHLTPTESPTQSPPLPPLATTLTSTSKSGPPFHSTNLNPASDFASPAESIKAYAPAITHVKPKPRDTHSSSQSPYDDPDTPSPVDFLASIASMPMKRQIREVDNGTVEALDSASSTSKTGSGGGGAGSLLEDAAQ
jgi:hypothetical protein